MMEFILSQLTFLFHHLMEDQIEKKNGSFKILHLLKSEPEKLHSEGVTGYHAASSDGTKEANKYIFFAAHPAMQLVQPIFTNHTYVQNTLLQ